ncbi:glycosyltransferase [Metabacillus indicus]|uniref:glycosyltransferase n=1 Tax=Metabacillus indicus TaxID=246786 RepID=UPI003CEEA0A5
MTKNMNTLSLCMIVRNEEKCLEKCLSSIGNFVDEIIVVDTGSTDGTIEIAKKFTDKVFHHKWKNDFSEARNFSLSKATSDYILVLDADEYIKNPEGLLNDLNNDKDCYIFEIQNLLSNGSSYIHRAYRMFRNHRGLLYKNKLHEQINLEVFPNALTATSTVTIFHTGYISTVFKDKEKGNRNLRIIEEAVKLNPNDYNLYNLGRAQLTIANYKDAIESFSKSYKLNKKSVYMPDLLNKMSLSLMELNRYEDALKIVKDAIEYFPNEVELFFTKGQICLKLNYLMDAKASFEQCLKIGDQGYQVTIGTGSYISNLKLAEMLETEGKLFAAFEIYTDILREEKNFTLGLIKFLEITTKTRIPLDDVKNTLTALYRIQSIQELKDLLDVLYNERHPLLMSVIKENNVNVQPHILATATLHSKKYSEAYQIFSEIEEIKDENLPDVLLVSYLEKSYELLNNKLQINLNSKDRQLLYNLVTQAEGISIKGSKELIDIVLKLFINLFLLDETLYKDKIQDILNRSPLHVKLSFSTLLINKNFNDFALGLIKGVLAEKPLNVKALETLGDIQYKMGQLNDSSITFNTLLKQDKKYVYYEMLYKIYVQTMQENKANSILKEINNKYPLVEWTKNIQATGLPPKTKTMGGEAEKVNNEFDELRSSLKANIQLLIEQGQVTEAKNVINEYEAIQPTDFDLYSYKSIVSMLEGDYTEAEKTLKEGLDVKPFDTDLLYNLAYLYESQNKYISAFRLYKKIEKISNGKLKTEVDIRIEKLSNLVQVKEYLNRKKVLVVAYIFPPLGGSGVQRTLKFIKYLRDFGWEPVVVTVAQDKEFGFYDELLLNEIPEELEVIRIGQATALNENYVRKLIGLYSGVLNDQSLLTEYIEEINKSEESFKNFIFLPDQYITFASEVLDKISELVDFNEVDMIYSTSGPYSDHIVGYYLKKQFSKPWVADFRDEWTNNPYFKFDRKGISYRIHKTMENNIINFSDKVLTVTPVAEQNYISDFNQEPNKVVTITNGYDNFDFLDISTKGTDNDKFKIMHNGTFYMIRTPITFLQAIKSLVDKGLVHPEKLEINFTWTENEDYWKEYVGNLGLSSNVNFMGYLSHKRSLEKCMQNHMLLLVIGPGEENKGVYPGKVFEYLKTNKRILSLSPKGSIVEELLTKSNRGLNFDFNDVEGIENYILSLYKQWQDDNLRDLSNEESIQKFERKNLTRSLSEIFTDLFQKDKEQEMRKNNYDLSIKDESFYDNLYENGGWNDTYFKHYSETHYFPMWKKALELIKENKESSIIDIGCGPGQFSNLLFDNGVTKYVGLDFSSEAIKVARFRNDKYRNLFIVGDAYISDIFYKSYNTTILFEVLEHLENDIDILRRIKPGTNVLFSVPNFYSAGHVRWFNSQFEVVERYKDTISIDQIHVFNVGGTNKLYLAFGKKI